MPAGFAQWILFVFALSVWTTPASARPLPEKKAVAITDRWPDAPMEAASAQGQ
jgi:hypothetical protein